MTTASGTREVPHDRALVWRALAVLAPYCAVCDVSYAVDGSGPLGRGTRFACAPGRLDGDARPPAGAPRGEIVTWSPCREVATRLDLGGETWTTRVEMADAGRGATRVTITLTHQARGGGRIARRLQQRELQRTVQRTVDGELEKLEAHVEQAQVS